MLMWLAPRKTLWVLLEQINCETLHSDWTAKAGFAYSSLAQTALTLPH